MPEQKYVEAEGSARISPERRMEMRRQLFAAYGANFPTAMERKPVPRLAFGDVSVGHLLAGLASGGFATSALWVDAVLLDTYTFSYWPVLAVPSANELLWLFLGAASTLTLCWSRGFLRRRDCLAVGVGLACFVPYAGVQVARMIAPLAAAFRHVHGHIHSFSPVDDNVGFVAYALGGLPTTPLGALGGWILWRFLSSPDHDERFDPHARLGSLFTMRVVLGLFLVALLPGLVFGILLTIARSPGPLPHENILFAWAMSTELIALLAGSLVLILLGKRKPIGRPQCLWLGTAMACCSRWLHFAPAASWVTSAKSRSILLIRGM